jgi:hypothetical protein
MKCSRKSADDRRIAEFNKIQEWHRWFAWFPVNDGMLNWFWFCFVERKYMLGRYCYWEYREKISA